MLIQPENILNHHPHTTRDTLTYQYLHHEQNILGFILFHVAPNVVSVLYKLGEIANCRGDNNNIKTGYIFL